MPQPAHDEHCGEKPGRGTCKPMSSGAAMARVVAAMTTLRLPIRSVRAPLGPVMTKAATAIRP